MTSCLMIYACVEHQIRKVLQENNASFPDMKKKPTQKPTAKWVFFCFQGISVLTIENTHQVVTNMMDRQRTLLDCFGSFIPNFTAECGFEQQIETHNLTLYQSIFYAKSPRVLSNVPHDYWLVPRGH